MDGYEKSLGMNGMIVIWLDGRCMRDVLESVLSIGIGLEKDWKGFLTRKRWRWGFVASTDQYEWHRQWQRSKGVRKILLVAWNKSRPRLCVAGTK